MRALLANLVGRHSVGLYLDEQEVTVCQVASTPLGLIELSRYSKKVQPDQLGTVVGELLTPLLKSRKPARVAVTLGIPTLRIFFSTRPIKSTTKSDASPHVLLQEALQSPTVSVDEMLVDLIKSRPGKRHVASLVACRKKYLAALLALLAEYRIKPPRAEPAPCALVRAAAQRYRAPRQAKVVLRAFLGEGRGLAVITTENQPIVWRTFDLPAGRERYAVYSVARVMQTLIKHCGIDSPLDVMMVHGPAPLQGLFEAPEFQMEMGARVVWCEGPQLDSGAIAYGLAVGGLKQPLEEFDLARSLKPRPSLWDVFPWGEFKVQFALLFCLALFYLVRAQGLHEDYSAVQAENARRPWAMTTPLTQMENEKKDLQQKVDAIGTYLGGRILWSSYTHDIAARLPATATLNSLQGLCEMELAGKHKQGSMPKKSLLMRAVVPMADNGMMPQEIDTFLSSLRGHPLLKRDFPVVELADLKSSFSSKTMPSQASFTVICLPFSAKVSPKDSAAKGKGKTAPGRT
jgi:hypothetical protein